MIYSEKEIHALKRDKRVVFPIKKTDEKKKEFKSDNSFLMVAIRGVFDLVYGMKLDIAKAVKDISDKIEKLPKSIPEPEKKSDAWDFKIVRDIDNRIQKIEATRR